MYFGSGLPQRSVVSFSLTLIVPVSWASSVAGSSRSTSALPPRSSRVRVYMPVGATAPMVTSNVVETL